MYYILSEALSNKTVQLKTKSRAVPIGAVTSYGGSGGRDPLITNNGTG